MNRTCRKPVYQPCTTRPKSSQQRLIYGYVNIVDNAPMSLWLFVVCVLIN